MSINHSGTERALQKVGGNRRAARDLIKGEIMTQAAAIARTAGCSLRCQRGEHSSDRYGCANDGSTCICACHDGGAS